MVSKGEGKREESWGRKRRRGGVGVRGNEGVKEGEEGRRKRERILLDQKGDSVFQCFPIKNKHVVMRGRFTSCTLIHVKHLFLQVMARCLQIMHTLSVYEYIVYDSKSKHFSLHEPDQVISCSYIVPWSYSPGAGLLVYLL